MKKDNGIVIDMNLVRRPYYYDWLDRFVKTDTPLLRMELTAEIIPKVITAWPFGDVTGDVYKDLGLLDAKAVDEELFAAMMDINKKK